MKRPRSPRRIQLGRVISGMALASSCLLPCPALARVQRTNPPEKAAPPPEAAKAEESAEAESAPNTSDEKAIADFTLPKNTKMQEIVEKFGKKPPNTDAKELADYASASVGQREAFSTIHREVFVKAPEAKDFAKQVIHRLLDAWPETGRPNVEVVIRDLPGYGAEAEVEGLLKVNLGAFAPDAKTGAASTDEFALLVGHELGHLLMRHLEHRTVRGAIVKKLASLASAWMAYGAVRRSTSDGHGHITLKADPGTVKRAFISGLAANTLIDEILGSSFNRRSEVEADLFAIDLAKAAHYRITESEANDFITRHENDRAERSQRIELLRVIVMAAAADQGLKLSQRAGNGLFSAFGALITAQSEKIVASVFDEVAKHLTAHPNTAVRTGIMHRYLQKLESQQDAGGGSPTQLGARNTAGLGEAKKSLPVRQTLPLLRQAEAEYSAILAAAASTQAKSAPVPGKEPHKAAASRALAGTPFEGRSWELAGDIANAAPGGGEKARAMADWQQSTETPFPSVEGAHLLATANIDAEKPVRLAPVVDRITKAYGTADPVLDVAIGAAIQAGDTAKAETLAARCVDYADGSLYPRCVAQLGYDPMSKDTPATTDEGKKAFAGKSLEHSFGWLNIFRKIL